MHVTGSQLLTDHLLSLLYNLSSLHRYPNKRVPIHLDAPVHFPARRQG